jgi:hypothetical protein
LTKRGAGPDGGIPGPKTTTTEKGSISPIRSLTLSETMSTDMTGAISTGARFITLLSDVGDVGDSLQPTSASGNRVMKIQRRADDFMWSGHLRGFAASLCRSHSTICFSTFAMQSAQMVCVIAASAVEPT